MRSNSPGFSRRSLKSSVNCAKHPMISAPRSSSLRCAAPSPPVKMSDHKVSFRRCSKGKSKRVASICVVSSMDTLSTQLKVSPIGRLSRILPARSRMIPSRFFRLGGATTGETVARCWSCRGGSIAMNMLKGPCCSRRSSYSLISSSVYSRLGSLALERLSSVIPCADENAS